MTSWLYIDNFRGFRNTCIPIKDVNFFVGENSTGKTSVLSILDLLGTPEFWTRQEFNTDDVKLGRFKDIISAQAKDKKQFRIGYIVPANGNEKKKNDRYEAVLLTFKEEYNNPLVYKCNFISTRGQISLIFDVNRILYKFSHDDKSTQSLEMIRQIFKDWMSEEQQDIKQYKKLTKRESFSRRQALLFIDRIIQQIYGEVGHNQDEHMLRVLVPEFASNISFLAPIRSKPRRTYDEYSLNFNPEGEHTPYLIKRLLSLKKDPNDFRHFIEKFGHESGLFESIDIKTYGREVASPFELRVVLNDLHLPVINVGYGVSQALPVIVDMFARPRGAQLAIQQPEVHLHPRAQAALGDIIYQLATEESKRFYIETHSDYTIDRFRLNYRTSQGKRKLDSQILFFGRNSEGNYIIPIEILENGEYPEEQPQAFREFFIHEEMRLLGL